MGEKNGEGPWFELGQQLREGGAFFMSGVKSKYCVMWKNLLTDFEPFYMVAKVSSFGGTRLTID